jgi:hypothetical protein
VTHNEQMQAGNRSLACIDSGRWKSVGSVKRDRDTTVCHIRLSVHKKKSLTPRTHNSDDE